MSISVIQKHKYYFGRRNPLKIIAFIKSTQKPQKCTGFQNLHISSSSKIFISPPDYEDIAILMSLIMLLLLSFPILFLMYCPLKKSQRAGQENYMHFWHLPKKSIVLIWISNYKCLCVIYVWKHVFLSKTIEDFWYFPSIFLKEDKISP